MHSGTPILRIDAAIATQNYVALTLFDDVSTQFSIYSNTAVLTSSLQIEGQWKVKSILGKLQQMIT